MKEIHISIHRKENSFHYKFHTIVHAINWMLNLIKKIQWIFE